jgi:hypothetical protein
MAIKLSADEIRTQIKQCKAAIAAGMIPADEGRKLLALGRRMLKQTQAA